MDLQDFQDMVDIAKFHGIFSLSLTKEDLASISLSPEYANSQISIVWSTHRANWIMVRRDNYESDFSLNIGLTHDLRMMLKNKVFQKALQKRCGINEYDELDYAYEDFSYPLSIELLSRTIKDDFPELSEENRDNSIIFLNQILRIPKFYQMASKLNTRVIATNTILDLIERVEKYADTNYFLLNSEQRLEVRKLNRLLLKRLYPNKIGTKHKDSPIDVHHNVLYINDFKNTFSLRSGVAEVCWLGYSENTVKFSVKNISKKAIPLHAADAYLVDADDNVLKCSSMSTFSDIIPHGWISPLSSFDLLKGMMVKVICKCEGLRTDTQIKRFIYKQNFYGHNYWYGVFSIFDFQHAYY